LSVAYPAADLLIVAILLPLAIARSSTRISSGALVAAFGAFAIDDCGRGADAIRGLSPAFAPTDVAGVVGCVLIALVALHPRLVELAAQRVPPSPRRDVLRTIGVSSAVLVPPLILLSSANADLDGDRVLESIVALSIAVLVVLRLHRTVRSLVDAEARFRQFMDSPGVLAVIKDARGRYRYMSRQALANRGLDHVEWFGRTDVELVGPAAAAERDAADDSVRREHRHQSRTETIGSATWQLEKFEIRDLPGWIGVLGVDVTDRQEAERRRREAEEQLRASDLMRREAGDRRTAERRLIGNALRELRPLGDLEASGRVVCEALVAAPEIALGTMVVFDALGAARVLAISGGDGHPLDPRPLGPRRSAYLRERALQGPWVERWIDDAQHAYQRTIADLGVAAHGYGPIVVEGQLLGLLIAGSAEPDAVVKLTEWLPGLVEFAEITAAVLGPALLTNSNRERLTVSMRRVIDEAAFAPVFQPIVDLRSRMVLGFEALARFADGRSPEVVFAEAGEVGLGTELEYATLRSAIEAARPLPADVWLNVNLSPASIDAPELRSLLDAAGRDVVIEITEHQEIVDYAGFREAFARLDGRARLCIDDAGAGFASLRHVVELAPAFVKLDRSLVAGVDRDQARQAVVAGLVHYAAAAGIRLVAEGIETRDELDVLVSLGIALGQGYLLGSPASLTGISRRPDHGPGKAARSPERSRASRPPSDVNARPAA
ncbi:MAG TPA: EAL domain-containing protein, partial [Candidatus Dormibacteraeota bacterium]|nr:EAL domain-containing protein [Candidatus Dormibacteraeota bacterium]